MKNVKGSITIEAAVIVPLILWIFALVVNVFFFYHDKNVITACMHETAVMSCGKENISLEEIEEYFHKKIQRRLLLFSWIEIEAEQTKKEVELCCQAARNSMKTMVRMSMSKTRPEEHIRNIRMIERLEKEIGEDCEGTVYE